MAHRNILHRIVMLGVFFLTAWPLRAGAGGDPSAQESAVKAMFIYNFTKYFDWQYPDPRAEFIIGVYGDTPVEEFLVEIARRKTVHDRKITIRKIITAADTKGVQLIFVPATEISKYRKLGTLPGAAPVVVSEGEGMIRHGVHIGLINMDGKLRFVLNESALRSQDISFAQELEALSFKTY